ncbi:OsmC family protein [Oleiagrimonas sp.]|jgi:organic hydroperoxide reductase OsmC/OhrA|uniref:OsmC family protein n=1 Tax=Oleiagrimonas sp. TaxID=2010330 RepID=UPI00261F8BF2|nr:OsmC family protein [Oleiagrimonas sp.]MDA3914624.1 OsmC family protein [Oleiagrimonas sp.]
MSDQDTQTFGLTLEQVDNYEFRVRFDDTAIPDLTTDEPEPLGDGDGPNPSRLLVAAIANCLAASLLFAMRKFKNAPGALKATAKASMQRNQAGRWRMERVAVDLHLSDPAAELEHLERIIGQFEDFCIVTQSVRQGVAVDVRVLDREGRVVN